MKTILTAIVLICISVIASAQTTTSDKVLRICIETVAVKPARLKSLPLQALANNQYKIKAAELSSAVPPVSSPLTVHAKTKGEKGQERLLLEWNSGGKIRFIDKEGAEVVGTVRLLTGDGSPENNYITIVTLMGEDTYHTFKYEVVPTDKRIHRHQMHHPPDGP